MNILLTNDDSIFSEGIKILAECLSQIGDIYVCAPDTQKSACGHGITVVAPIMASEIKFPYAKKAWKVGGTPADCVKLGVKGLIGKEVKIDLVVSGINHGANLGTDVIYSGTVAGAMEGLIMGYPSIALSIDSHMPNHFGKCCEILLDTWKFAIDNFDGKTMININVPYVDPADVKGIKITKIGAREYEEDFSRRQNPLGQTYFWYSGVPKKYENLPSEIDVIAVQENYISISPLHYDLTNYSYMETLNKIIKP